MTDVKNRGNICGEQTSCDNTALLGEHLWPCLATQQYALFSDGRSLRRYMRHLDAGAQSDMIRGEDLGRSMEARQCQKISSCCPTGYIDQNQTMIFQAGSLLKKNIHLQRRIF